MKVLNLDSNSVSVKQLDYATFSSFINAEKRNRSSMADFDNLLYIEPEYQKLKDRYALEDYCGIYVNDVLIGYCAYSRATPNHLGKLYVSKDYRRKGIAGEVIKSLGFTSVCCLKSNKGSIAFYESLGFVIDHKEQHPGHVVMFRK